jgi:DNA-binding beta-propeller fold protein YncE
MKTIRLIFVLSVTLISATSAIAQEINLSIKAQIPGTEVTNIWSGAGDSRISGLTLSPDGSKLYAAYWTDSGSDHIEAYSTSNYSLVETMRYGTCHGGVAVSNDGRYIYTPSYYQGNVSRFDTYNGNSRTDLSAGEWSSGISKSPDGTKLIVYSGLDGGSYDMGNDRINVYDISNGAFSTIGSIQMPDEPRGFKGSFSNDGKYIYVPTYQRQSATARLYEVSIDGTLGINRYLEFPGNSLECAAENYDSIFVSDSVNQKIWMIDKATWSIADSIDLSYQPGTVVLDQDGQNLFVGGNGIVSVFDITTKSLKSSLINIQGSITDIVLSQDGSLAYASYASGSEGGIAIINVPEPATLFLLTLGGLALRRRK